MLEATGMTATGIKASKLKEMPILIPPMAEQKRIITKLGQLMSMCDTLKRDMEIVEAKQVDLLQVVVAQA